MNERETIDRGWYYVVEPDGGRHAPDGARILADDGQPLTRRLHGVPGRVDVRDTSGAGLPAATVLRAAAAAGRWLEAHGLHGHALRVSLGPRGAEERVTRDPDHVAHLTLDGPRLADDPTHHHGEARVAALLDAVGRPGLPPQQPGGLPERPTTRALFFESLMNTDMPHNDREISQGVLHMISPLRAQGTEVVLVNTKMPIVGDDRPVIGLDNLVSALRQGPVGFIGITLLEGYWEGVLRLVHTIRELGCRARIAVGGVMPTLAPEHVAAHLPDVSFVCRGAGEVFVPALCRVLGDTDVDTPLSEAQVDALLRMDGLLAIDRLPTGLRLLSCRSDRTRQVDDLDRVPLDLSHVQARHIEGGIELSTSRGCIHKCSFCSILGRESYQARSAGSILDVLAQYERRFWELHPDGPPPQAWRVHFSDDDFACDKARAAALFRQILDTRFRLSSVQVAIGDLCRKEGGKLLPEPDLDLLDAMKPACFADHGRPIPEVDYFEDHRSRTWSSFLQIGVETYSDREIARLGKGYKRVHVRAMVAELARRDLHMDGYFILANAETTLEDLVEVFSEVARLKLRFPKHFHMRFPVVPNLVSYFTSASHRRHVRLGRRHVMKLRGFASVPAHPEYDYPFVDHDEPLDAWVQRTVNTGFVTDEGFYTRNLDVLRDLWAHWRKSAPPEDHARLDHLLRRLDDLPRRLVFEMLRQAWLADDDGWPAAQLDKDEALRHAERVLGPHDRWFPVFRHALRVLRHRHLTAAVATPAHVRRAAAALAASDAPHRVLRLVGPLGPGALDAAREAADDLVVEVPGAALGASTSSAAGLSALCSSAEEARAARAAGATVVAVVPLTPGRPLDLSAAPAADEVRLVVAPATWTPAACQALASALFTAAKELDGRRVTLTATTPAAALDLDGAWGRDDALTAEGLLRRAGRAPRVDPWTGVDRVALDVADAILWPELPSLDALSKASAPAEKVVRSFLAWRERPSSGAAAGA